MNQNDLEKCIFKGLTEMEFLKIEEDLNGSIAKCYDCSGYTTNKVCYYPLYLLEAHKNERRKPIIFE